MTRDTVISVIYIGNGQSFTGTPAQALFMASEFSSPDMAALHYPIIPV